MGAVFITKKVVPGEIKMLGNGSFSGNDFPLTLNRNISTAHIPAHLARPPQKHHRRLPQALISTGFSETQYFSGQNWLFSQACPRFITEKVVPGEMEMLENDSHPPTPLYADRVSSGTKHPSIHCYLS